jgi:hypothetical protein
MTKLTPVNLRIESAESILNPNVDWDGYQARLLKDKAGHFIAVSHPLAASKDFKVYNVSDKEVKQVLLAKQASPNEPIDWLISMLQITNEQDSFAVK